MNTKPNILNISEEWLDEIRTIFQKLAPEFEVWAYGSRITGRSHNASDLDLVLIHPTDSETARCENCSAIREALSESNIPISVDVMDWARIPQDFREQINRQKVKLF